MDSNEIRYDNQKIKDVEISDEIRNELKENKSLEELFMEITKND